MQTYGRRWLAKILGGHDAQIREVGEMAMEEVEKGNGGRVYDGGQDEDGCGGAGEEGNGVVCEGGVEMDAGEGAAGDNYARCAGGTDELFQAGYRCVGEGGEGRGGEGQGRDGVELQFAEGGGETEEAGDVVIEGEGGGEVDEVWEWGGVGEDPGGVCVEEEVEGDEFGHVLKCGSEEGVEAGKDRCGGVDGDVE